VPLRVETTELPCDTVSVYETGRALSQVGRLTAQTT
jgi:hypothetical protein